ncbi:MAG: virulence RhuM family protein [Sphingomonadaceae bacterium]|nr:virulence RhuM family protein [Sphingomonadaceae bacterium]
MAAELIQYQTEDGATVIRLQARDGNVWLSQAEIAELFQITPQAVTQHIRTIYEDGELEQAATCKDYLQVRTEGKREVSRQIAHYSLPLILAVGFRVRSPRGAQFRRWAAEALSEYLVKGFVMDDERLKDPEADYFDELLARIRDIRSSEKLFYKKVLEIYATSVDYDKGAEASQRFFQTVQNKMHWAAHGHTAAEVIHARADSAKDHMGLTSWAGEARGLSPRKSDVAVAKNYLSPVEIDTLNRIVTLYLDFAELQAQNRKQMFMADWIAKLNQFLNISDRDILTHAGRVSAEVAKARAEAEYGRWSARTLEAPSGVERHFLEATQAAKRIGAGKKPKVKGGGA